MNLEMVIMRLVFEKFTWYLVKFDFSKTNLMVIISRFYPFRRSIRLTKRVGGTRNFSGLFVRATKRREILEKGAEWKGSTSIVLTDVKWL